MLAGAGALAASGCSTVSDVRADRGTGVIVNYAAPFDQMWSALPSVLKELGLKVASENMAEGYMLIESGGSTYGWGDSAILFVERIGTKGNCRVEVAPKGTLGVNLSLSDWPKRIHDRLAQRFKRL
jgi:hypothetical protein